ncbi:Ig-like domain-containing protein [Pseudoalteromonas obscura]|uniref:Ig-like domain-containing protein n=1 Tax=Pseudoalteromonas obscura TaxID=3048491 RepID=A0ABT7EUF2_9GAMM|nr:Ig-like domain-containing protein [Pseudoalteromonas sp. P94(2023)]MDK2598610.1 Ig-like domain-containing protein [Pseudoalteromonas sp. P94(2023)]
MQMSNLISALTKKFITISMLFFAVFNSYALEKPVSLVLKESFGSDPYSKLAYHNGSILVSGKVESGSSWLSANLDILKYGDNGFELLSQTKLTSKQNVDKPIQVISIENHNGHWVILAYSSYGHHVFSASIVDGRLNILDELHVSKHFSAGELVAGHNNNLYLIGTLDNLIVTHVLLDESGKLEQKESLEFGISPNEPRYNDKFSVSYDNQSLYLTSNQDEIGAGLYQLPLADNGAFGQVVELKLANAKSAYHSSQVSGDLWFLSYHYWGFQVARIEGDTLKIIYESTDNTWYNTFEVKGNQLLAIGTFGSIDVYDIQNNESALLKSQLYTKGFLEDATLVGETLLVTKDSMGIEAVNLSGDGTLTSLHTFNQSGDVSDIAIHENELAVSAFQSNLHFWQTDASKPATLESTYHTVNNIQGVEWVDDEIIINSGSSLESHLAEDLKKHLDVGINHGTLGSTGTDGRIVKTDNGFVAKAFTTLSFIDADKNILSQIDSGFRYGHMAVANNLLFVSKGSSEIIIYDMSDLSKVTELSRIEHQDFYAGEVVVTGNILYAFGSEELLIFDISKPNKPVRKSSVSINTDTRNAFSYVYDDLLIAIFDDKGLLFDISNPEKPIQIDENSQITTNGVGNGFGKEIYTVASSSAGRINRVNLNYAPTQKDLQIELVEDGQTTVALSPIDAESDKVTISIAVEPKKGSVSIQDNNTLLYEGAANQNGTDSVRLLIQDTHGSASYFNMTVNILPMHDAPSFHSDVLNMSVVSGASQSSTLDVINIDGGKLKFEVTEQAARGTATVDEQGVLTYTANAGSSGADKFVVTVTDEAGAKVSKTVNVNTIEKAAVTQSDNSDSGGGSFTLFSLFTLLILGARRRCRPALLRFN